MQKNLCDAPLLQVPIVAMMTAVKKTKDKISVVAIFTSFKYSPFLFSYFFPENQSNKRSRKTTRRKHDSGHF